MFTSPLVLLGITTLAIASSACGNRTTSPAPGSASAAVALKSAAPSSSVASAPRKPVLADHPPIEISAPMKEFMVMVAEDHKLSGAVTKFAAPSLNDRGVGLDPLDSPRVVGTDPSAGECYIVEGVDGPATHDYLVCWQSGQIIQVADQGMK